MDIFLGLVYVLLYIFSVNSKNTPRDIIQEITAITHMERGKLSVIRQGPHGPYYNLQRRENGRNVSEYIPAGQVEEARANTEAFAHFETLVENLVEVISAQSREERKAGDKKRHPPQIFSSPKRLKSKT